VLEVFEEYYRIGLWWSYAESCKIEGLKKHGESKVAERRNRCHHVQLLNEAILFSSGSFASLHIRDGWGSICTMR